MVAISFMVAVAAIAVFYVFFNFFKIKALDEGTPDMIDKASIVRSGARTFIGTVYIRIGIVAAIVAILISGFIERTAGITFLIGAAVSGAACVLGMEDSTYANVRVANRARKTESLSETLQVALLGGSVPGLSVPAFLLVGLIVIWLIYGGPKYIDPGAGVFMALENVNASIMRFTTFSLGASVVAMFSRVAGGNFTKAADISADIVGKNRYGLEEDDARIPNVIADFIGDNVNDIAGNCSDLQESTGAAVIAASLIGYNLYNNALANGDAVSEALFSATTLYPILILAGGLLSCLVGLVYMIQLRKKRRSPSSEINLTTYVSAGLTVISSLVISYFVFGKLEVYKEWTHGWLSPWIATVLGIGCGVAIGAITEYYTSTGAIKNKFLRKLFKVKPTTQLAEIAHEGEAFEVTLGDSLGFRSVLAPCIFIVLAIVFASNICGDYGLAMAALGMLSFVGATVTIDAFGPIADNAGGLAESCHLGSNIRKITDELDAVGNTTAAIGKGFAIGSAALATVSLTRNFVGSYTPAGQPLILNAASSYTTAGMIFGAALVCYFSGLLLYNAIKAAQKMADDGDEKLNKILNEGADPKPMYIDCIKTAAKEALSRMTKPSVIALVVPAIVGFLFGLEFIGGTLNGSTAVAICLAIFFGNSGGAFDNAKKMLEQGIIIGMAKLKKDTELYKFVHRVLVACDTIGDPRKDSVGVALDIFIKIMSTVTITLVPFFMTYSLVG